MSKKLKNFRLTDTAIQYLAELAEKKGVSEAVIIELLIREAHEANKKG
jgi:hypothetical protein